MPGLFRIYRGSLLLYVFGSRLLIRCWCGLKSAMWRHRLTRFAFQTEIDSISKRPTQ